MRPTRSGAAAASVATRLRPACPFARKAIRLGLERLGFDVCEAESGIEGIKLAMTGEFRLIVTDILMPDKDGIETILEIRRGRSRVKILAVSGGGRVRNDAFLKAASELGADGTLSKPFEMQDLMAKVKSLFPEIEEVSPVS